MAVSDPRSLSIDQVVAQMHPPASASLIKLYSSSFIFLFQLFDVTFYSVLLKQLLRIFRVHVFARQQNSIVHYSLNCFFSTLIMSDILRITADYGTTSFRTN